MLRCAFRSLDFLKSVHFCKFRGRKKLSAYQKDLIKEQLMAGKMIEETAGMVHSSNSSVMSVKKTLGTKVPSLKRGRKPVVTYREIEDMKIQCQKKNCLVASDCVKYCEETFGKKVSKSTVLSRLSEVGSWIHKQSQ
jgi:transposase